MKKSVIALLATLLAGPLVGCQNHDAAPVAETPETMAETYQGTLPCADCAGIQVSLSLRQGGRYMLNERYSGTNEESTAQQGRWTRTAERLVLVSDKGEKRYFRPLNDGLEMLDKEGLPIRSTHRYQLMPVKTVK
ncbi:MULTISPECIES: copper resistance protein NlpE N-terminal domain-containing protein [Erwinia]|uniref:copper resistance protein NlpE N-terminal domain-containing protein n=1 Tax=Erwinia TaxID=551 RepID=UPI00068AE6AA|nr:MULTISPECIES: copper resistance protein NlpE N-terminal domain-containing protein [Erwinia]